jgi:hypothetical protein
MALVFSPLMLLPEIGSGGVCSLCHNRRTMAGLLWTAPHHGASTSEGGRITALIPKSK